MTALRRLLRRLAALITRRRDETRLHEEVEQHLALQTAENIRAGMSAEEARRQAVLKFGAVEGIKEGYRESQRLLVLEEMAYDIRSAFRMFHTHRGFTILAVLILAVGIGATTAIFSVVNAVLINPLPYPASDRLVSIVHTVNGRDEPYFGDAIYKLYTEQNTAFEAFGVWSPYAGSATVTGNSGPEEVRVLAVSHGLLTTLGMRPATGRAFSNADDTPGAPGTVILTYTYWHQKFGGAPDILNRVLTINSRPHQVIGVMPPEFSFGGAVVNHTMRASSPEILLPLQINTTRPVPVWRHLGVARLKPEVSLQQASADVARMVAVWSAPSELPPAFRNTRYGVSLRLLKDDVVGHVGRILWVLMSTIGIVLLMACANVATLLLVRADARRQEFAVRAALGARWTRLARAHLVESLMLALIGGALGVALAYVGVRVLVANGPADLPRLSEIAITGGVFRFAALLSLASGVLLGCLPVLRFVKPQLAMLIHGTGRGMGPMRDRQRSQHALVAAQIALAFVLLVSSGLMIRTFDALRRVDPGFTHPEHVQTFSVSIPVSAASEAEQITRMQQDMVEQLSGVRGVTSVAFTSRLPMDTSGRTSFPLFAEGKPDDGKGRSRQIRFISPGMFGTLGTPVVSGGDFTWTDMYGTREVAIVTESLARELWGSSSDAVGKRVREGSGVWREVVGVTRDIYDEGVHEPPTPTLFLPARLHLKTLGLPAVMSRRVTFIVRSERTGSEGLITELRKAVWSTNASLPLAQERTLGEVYDQTLAQTSFTLLMLVISGAIALLLGVSGLFGVISYAVSQRLGEIGIRTALGAQPREIRRLFMQRGVIVTVTGIGLGVAGAVAFSQLMQSLLFNVSPLDAMTFSIVPIVLAAVALAACYVPARRAARIDALVALRYE